jgi:hypothetical protein
VAWNDISVVGCTNTGGGTAVCATLQSFQNDFLNGTYGSWTGQNENSTPTNLQFTANGFGGGYQIISPQVSTESNRTLRVNLTLEATSTANGLLGPIVVLQDGDGTQLLYGWYGQSPGTNLVLTQLLSTGTPVSAQPGTIPGFDFTTISYFHVQLDPSSYTDTYTVSWNNLDIIGCAPPPDIVITSWSYDPSAQVFNLTWTSVAGGTYTVESAPEATGPFNDLVPGIPSAGTNTTVSFSLADPNRSFVRVRRD